MPKLQQENKVVRHINIGALPFLPETLRSQNGVSLYLQYNRREKENWEHINSASVKGQTYLLSEFSKDAISKTFTAALLSIGDCIYSERRGVIDLKTSKRIMTHTRSACSDSTSSCWRYHGKRILATFSSWFSFLGLVSIACFRSPSSGMLHLFA